MCERPRSVWVRNSQVILIPATLFESLSGKMRSTSAEIIGEVWTYYFCRSEAVSRGVKEGALCNKPNKEVIDRSTGSFLPAKTEAGSLAVSLFFFCATLARWV